MICGVEGPCVFWGGETRRDRVGWTARKRERAEGRLLSSRGTRRPGVVRVGTDALVRPAVRVYRTARVCSGPDDRIFSSSKFRRMAQLRWHDLVKSAFIGLTRKIRLLQELAAQGGKVRPKNAPAHAK